MEKKIKKKPVQSKAMKVKKPVGKSALKPKGVQGGIELKTAKLKEMVGRAVKGASFKSIIPLTSMMAIELKDSRLTLKTTDSTNYLYIMEDKIPGDDFYAVVLADQFAKLISKMTCENVTLTLKSNALEVVGNGKYLIELQQEDEGGMIQFPDPRAEAELEPLENEIQLTTVLSILGTAKSSLATTLENPCYTGYYCGDRVLTTNTFKICGMDLQLWEEPRLISSEMMELLSVMTVENISVDAAGDEIMFSSPDCVVYGRTMEGIEDFQVEDIEGVLDMEFPSMCKLKKSHVLQLLDRLSLFVTSMDKDEVDFAFTKEGLQVSSKASSGTELIKYLESEDFSDFVCSVDIGMLIAQVKAIVGDTVELYYGDENALKLVEGNTVQVLSLQGTDAEADDELEDAAPFDEEDDEALDDEE